MAAAAAAGDDPTSPNKTVLGRYELGRVLGRGSFAKVYYARSLSDQKSVAIKVIDKLKTNPSIHPNIINEVAAMRRLNHPNILRIHEVMATKHKIYMVMELAKGGDLFAKLSRRSDHRFPEPIARRYFYQLISALDYCHRNGIVHRDVKPQNVLLDDQGNVKVADFGLAAIIETPLNNNNSNNSDHLLKTRCGTPAFAAPEIIGRTRGGYDGSKADAWSCGVILFVLLLGYLPFDDANLVLMYRNMFKKEFRFPSWLSKPARGIITRLLDPNPETRLSIQGIMEDTWLKNQGNVYRRSVSLGDMASSEENNWSTCSTSMNAFEIISMSSALDLSGFFITGDYNGKREKRFTSRESKDVVVDKVAETGLKLGYEVEKTEKGVGSVWLGKGSLVLSVAVIEVAADVVVVEVRVVDGGGVGSDKEDLHSHWGDLKIGLADIVLSWHNE